MSSRDVPSWISVERGSAPILLFAPHGGRRHDLRIPGKHKVNDLRTAEVTRELAGALDASAIINQQVDRNRLDLNRVSQVRRDAPWLIDLLTALLTEMVAVAGRATVLVVHGWNVSQVACDVGVGMREQDGEVAPVGPGTATVSSAFVATHLRPFQAAAARSGIMVTIGSRYPAAHPNNLLQIFGAAGDVDAADLAPLSALGRCAPIDAAQLELAIPLRWPGARRERFVALVSEVFGARNAAPASVGEARSVGPTLRVGGGRVSRRRGLQLVTDELLLMTSIDAGDGGTIGGRVVVSERADRLALFTGELADADREWTVPPLAYEAAPGAPVRFAYEGPLVAFPNHAPFLDLERGLAEGTVVEARLDLSFERDAPDRADEDSFGTVHGELVVDGRRHVIATRGLAIVAEAPVRARFPQCRVTLPIGSFGASMLASDPLEPWQWEDGCLRGTLVGTVEHGNGPVAVRALATVRISESIGSLMLEPTSGWRGTERLSGSLERMIPVRRPGPLGSVIATTFALVRVDGASVGWLEASVVNEDPDRPS